MATLALFQHGNCLVQKLVGVPEDGAVGPATLEAVQRKAKENIKGLINESVIVQCSLF